MCKPKYESLSDILPTLTQVQNYTKYKRLLNDDTNDIDAFVRYANNLKYSGETNPFELFCFGSIYGDGSSENHFQIGFSSEKIIERIKEFNNQGCKLTKFILTLYL